MPHVDNGGVQIYYEVEGRGPPLVLQHGFSGTMDRWRQAGYVDALKSQYRLILIDARGHGQSDKPHEQSAYTLAQQVSDVTSVLDHLSIKQAIYWGYSMGGRIGFAMAGHAPQYLLALVIGGAHPYARQLHPSDRLDGSDPEAFVRALYKRTGTDLKSLPEPTRRELFANDFRALAALQQDWPSIEDVLPTMRMPCMLYVGDADVYSQKILNCAEQMPGARLVVLPGLDHGCGFRAAEQVLPHVVPFLEDVRSGTSSARGDAQRNSKENQHVV